jgi:hypothetical protein
MPGLKKKIKEEIHDVRLEVRNRTIGYIVAAFGLVAGLAWNDAIKALIDYIFPATKNGLQAKFIYATLITLVAVFFTVYLMRLLKKDEEKQEAKQKKKSDE